jgi:hypothetical protein
MSEQEKTPEQLQVESKLARVAERLRTITPEELGNMINRNAERLAKGFGVAALFKEHHNMLCSVYEDCGCDFSTFQDFVHSEFGEEYIIPNDEKPPVRIDTEFNRALFKLVERYSNNEKA